MLCFERVCNLISVYASCMRPRIQVRDSLIIGNLLLPVTRFLLCWCNDTTGFCQYVQPISLIYFWKHIFFLQHFLRTSVMMKALPSKSACNKCPFEIKFMWSLSSQSASTIYPQIQHFVISFLDHEIN